MTITELPAQAKLPAPPAQSRPRRRRPGNALVLMTLAGMLCALASYTLLRDRDLRYRVAVATGDIRAGTLVTVGDFAFTDVKIDEAVVAGLLQAGTVAQVDGWIASDGIAEGELVSLGDLRPPSAPADLRAMSLPLDPEDAVAGDLEAGDRIDVIAVVDGASSYVAADLGVIAVSSQDTGGALSSGGRFSVTLAVNETTALALARASSIGDVTVVRSTGSTKVDVTGGSISADGTRAVVSPDETGPLDQRAGTMTEPVHP